MSKKFNNITFPLFGLKNYLKFEFSLDKIFAVVNNQKYIVDDRSIDNSSYLSRLIELDSRKSYQRLKFDYTIRSMEELIKSDCKIALDNTGKFYNFTNKELFPYSERRIEKIRKKYFWFKNISYPFEIDVENLSEIEENQKYYYGKLVKINSVWYFLGLTDENSNKIEIWL